MGHLGRETPKDAVCTVFEKVNTGGVPLNVFELLTATYAGDTEYFTAHGSDFQLPAHWKQVRDELAEHPMLRVEDSDFLQAVCLVSTHHRRRGRPDVDPFTQPAASCKRGDILDLPLEEFIQWSPQIVSALHRHGDRLAGGRGKDHSLVLVRCLRGAVRRLARHPAPPGAGRRACPRRCRTRPRTGSWW